MVDKEHTTAMGNVRLFFKGETDWQNNLKSGWTNMMGTIKTWFKDNIYDKTISIEIINKIRDEEKFSSIDELKTQLKKDEQFCLKLINK